VLDGPGNLSGDLGLGHAVHALCIGRFTALVGTADDAEGDRFPEWFCAPEVVMWRPLPPDGRGMAALGSSIGVSTAAGFTAGQSTTIARVRTWTTALDRLPHPEDHSDPSLLAARDRRRVTSVLWASPISVYGLRIALKSVRSPSSATSHPGIEVSALPMRPFPRSGASPYLLRSTLSFAQRP